MSEPPKFEPNDRGPSLGDRARDAVNWLLNRSRDEWIMFGFGFVVGVIVS